MANAVTIDRPTPNTPEAHKERLEKMGTTWGSASITRYKDAFVMHADFAHNVENAQQNLHALLDRMLNYNLSFIGKAYGSDYYERSKPVGSREWQALLNGCSIMGERIHWGH